VEDSVPEEPDNWKDGLPPKVVHEVQHIIDRFSETPDGGIQIGVARSGNRVDHFHAERQILVREEYLGRVLEILQPDDEREPERDYRRLERDYAGQIEHVIPGIVLLTLAEKQLPTLEALDRVDEELGRGIATPNHVLTVSSGEGSPCAATEPQEVYDEIEPFPSVCRDNSGAGVLIYIEDTGLLEGADATHPWLAGVHGEPDPLPPVAKKVQPIPEYTGHGTFVAGVARCMAPGADINVSKILSVAGRQPGRHSIAGSQLEHNWIRRLEAALGLGADIVQVSVVTHTRHDLPPITFQVWLEHLREYGGAVCVAPAGNDGSRRLTWPGAFAEVISVGALGSDWRGRATFSNFGSWVDVYAPGRDLVNAYATGTYTCNVAPYKGDPRTFYGMAKWSGTSFSAPIVSGLIAARISRTGETARQAAAALLAEARSHAIPGVGPVLLPRGGDARGDPECCCHAHRHRHDTC
jgi:subtilisin family serine protease